MNTIFERKLNSPERATNYLTYTTVAMTVFFTLSGLGYLLLPGPSSPDLTFPEMMLNTTIVVITGGLGLLIQRKYPGHMVANLLLLLTLVTVIRGVALILRLYNEQFTTAATPIIETLTLVVGKSFYLPVIYIPLFLIPLYFPTGRLLTPRWRPLAIGFLVFLLGTMLIEILRPWPEPVPTYIDSRVFNGIHGQQTLFEIVEMVLGISFVSIVLLVIINISLRYRRSSAVERAQMKWPFVSIVGAIGIALIVWNSPALHSVDEQSGYLITWGLVMLYPVSMAVAILQHRLWDIDIVINRALVYGSLSALIVLGYFALVGLLGALFHTQFNAISGIIITAVIAILFQPIRERLQNAVNRLFYGERDYPDTVLSRLADRIQGAEGPAGVLPNLVETVAVTLNVPYVAFKMPNREDELEPLASWGRPVPHVEELVLAIQNEEIGKMLVGWRSPQESFTRNEIQLLNSIAAISANVIQAVKLSDELRLSRRRIVNAREEERRRLRRDLHDGLGPQLASQTLGLEAVAQYIPPNNEKALSLLESLKQQAENATKDVRRIVYDLRPPALDTLGLEGALQQFSHRLEGSSLRITLDFPQKLPNLPAAVETAIFRIVQEALTNVVRHARANTSRVSVRVETNHLLLEVRDNGRGFSAQSRSGVGIQAMHERVAELNGILSIETLATGGTIVQAAVPLEAEYE